MSEDLRILLVEDDPNDAALIEQGRALIQSDTKCTDCHQFRKPDEEATAPNLTGYASRQWLMNFSEIRF